MIEIIALIYFSRIIGNLAVQKGLSAGKWKFYVIALWFLLEIIGVIVGLMIFSPDNFLSIALVGLGFAITSYFIIKNYLQKLPDTYDDIDKIGT
jgi:ABC-type maltose transport system permease subunit